MHDCDTSWLEGVFARGDRALAPVLERAYRAGARFDSWEDQKKMDVWEEAFRAEGVDPAEYLGTIPVTARLPWDHIDVGLEEGFLLREYRKALEEPPVAPVRQGRRRVRPRARTCATPRPTTASSSATTAASRAICRRCASSASSTCASSAPTSRARPRRRRVRAAEGARPPKLAQARGARRYRFVYEKLGAARVPLAPRRRPRAAARVPPARAPALYSQGFHPKPDMTFGPALSLGVASLGRGRRHEDRGGPRPGRAARRALRRARSPACASSAVRGSARRTRGSRAS